MTEIIPKPDDVEIPEDKEWEEMSARMRHYYRNKEEERERIKSRKEELVEWVREKRTEEGCTNCGSDHPAVLDFHHIGEKSAGVQDLAYDGYSKEKIREEMKKCVVLCSNCHRKKHWEE
jgi:hypothetical protein